MILNLTQHPSTDEQKAAGTLDLAESEVAGLQRLLTFDELPACQQIEERAAAIADLAREYLCRIAERPDNSDRSEADINATRCMIGGAPFLMAALTHALRSRGLVPVCAFSRRESVDEGQVGGSVTKRSVFRHLGFVNLPQE